MSDDFDDPVYHKALPWLRAHQPPQPIFCSKLQNAFTIGYNRAMRILERAESEGVISHDKLRGNWLLVAAK